MALSYESGLAQELALITSWGRLSAFETIIPISAVGVYQVPVSDTSHALRALHLRNDLRL
jgi:hypothetical protein